MDNNVPNILEHLSDLERGQLENDHNITKAIIEDSNISQLESPESNSDSDQLSKNTELFSAMRRKLKKGKSLSEEDRLDEIKESLSNGADVNAVDKNNKGNTLLHLAVKKRYEKIVKFLLHWPKINTRIANEDGKTAKILAQDLNNQNIIEFFAQYGQQEISSKRKSKYNGESLVKKVKYISQENSVIVRSLGNSKKRILTDDDTPRKKVRLDNLTMPSEGIKLAEHGNIFQLKLLMLCLWRANHTEQSDQITKYKEFRLATEMPEAEKFDDIAFQYKEENSDKWKFRLLQAKHKEGVMPSDPLPKIKLIDLLSVNDDEAFSLQKYFHSYLKILRRSEEHSIYSVFSGSEIEDIIVITNTDFNSNREESIFVKDTKDIKEDALLKTCKPDTLVYKLRDEENTTIINQLKIVSENSSDFYKIIELLADHILSNKQIDKTNLFKEYYYPLVNEILKIDVKIVEKEKKYFINLENVIKKKCVNGEVLSEEAIKIRDSLIKEMAFRKGTIRIPEIDKSFGNSDLADDDKELNELAMKVAEFIKQNKEFALNNFDKYHVVLAQKVLDIEHRKLSSKFIKESSNPHNSKEASPLGKFKKCFMQALNKQTIKDLKNIIDLDIAENFGRSELSSDEITLKTLAIKLAESINQNKKLSAVDFPYSHVGLAEEVIDTSTQTFHKIFINGQDKRNGKVKVLSPEAKKLRRILLDEIDNQDILITINDKKTTIKKLDEPLLHNLLCKSKVQVSEGFANVFKPERNPEIKDIVSFAKQMIYLIKYSSQNKEQRVIEINDNIKTELKINNEMFNDNIKKLAGYVLIYRFHKVCFSTAFLNLKSEKLPGNINEFRAKLKELLGNDQFEFESLCEYELKFDKKFNTFEDGELYRKLPVVHSDNDVKQFFSKLKFIVNYPNRKAINNLLQPEIKDKFKTLDSEVFQSSYYENLHNWMADRVGTFYTAEKTKELFKQIQNNLSLWTIDGFNKPYFADSSQEYRFKKYNKLYKFLLGDKQVLQLICQDLFLGHTRLVQGFQELQAADVVNTQQYTRNFGHIFLYLKQLEDRDFRSKVYDVLKKNTSKFNLVVMECNTQQQKIEELYIDLDEVIKCNSNTKVIFITTEDNDALERKFATDKYKNNIGFYDLTQESQKNLLGQKVVLQGQSVSLNKLIDESCGNVENIIDVETLVKLIKGEEIIIGRKLQDLGEVNDYYIDRRLKQITFSKEKIKKYCKESSSKSDLFVISGTESGLEGNNNIYACDNAELAGRKFKELCEQNTESNIHWLESCSKKLTWCKSHGSVSNLIRYKIKTIEKADKIDNTRPSSLKDISEDNHKIVIISNTAGMGKSVALTSLSMTLKQQDSSLWVIKINLNDHTKVLYEAWNNRKSSKLKFSDQDTNKVVNFVLNDLLASQEQSKLKTTLEQELFKTSFNSNGKIALLFDGFDEISPYYKDIVIDLLQSLKKSKIEKLFITTRPNMGEELERALEIFSHVLDPLSSEEQIEFLTKFWIKKLGLKNLDERYTERLKTYAESIIERISKSINDKEQEFIAVPLQTRMVAEVFQEDQEGIVSEWQSCKDFLELENDKPKLPTDFALLDLYEHFVKMKFYKFYLEEKQGRDFTKVNERRSADESYTIFKEKCVMLALYTLFSEKELEKLLSTEKIQRVRSHIEDIKSAEHNEGIVDQIIDNKPNFLHRTFAEYFASFLIVKKILTAPADTLQCIDNMLLNASPVFINNMIELLDGQQETITSVLKKPLLHFVLENHSNFIKSLVQSASNAWAKKLDTFGKTPLHYAIEYDHLNIVEKLLDYANDIYEKDILVHGSFKKPEYANSKLIKFIDIQDKFGKTALYYAIQKKHLDSAFTLLLKGASIASLTDIHVNILIHKMLRGNDYKGGIYDAGILTAYANQENKYRPIEEKLFLKTPDVFKELSKKDQCRILSYFFVHGRVEVIKALLGTIDDSKQRTDILNYADNSNKPLDRVNNSAQLSDDDRLEITKYLLTNGGIYTTFGIGFSSCDENNSSNNHITKILQAAAREGHIKTFEYFIDLENPEHYHIHLCEAAQYNQHNIIKYFSENNKKNVEINGNTALHTACDRGANLKIIKDLINNGEFINAENNKGETPLFMAIYARSELHVIDYLVRKNADINWEDKLHNTPLSYAIRNDQVGIIQYLVRRDARISERASQLIKDQAIFWKNPNQFDLNLVENGFPRLHTAIKSSNFEWAKFLVRYGADINKVDTQGKTPLHWASELEEIEIVELLLQYGAFFDKRDDNNTTPRLLSKSDKIIWLLDVLDTIFSSQNLIQDLNTNILECESGSILKDWGPYGQGYPDAWDGDNPMLIILNTRNSQGRTLLHIAASTGDTHTINILLKWNRDYLGRRKESLQYPRYKDYQSTSIDTTDSEGNAPLHLSAQKGHNGVVSLLLDKGAIFNKNNKKGYTPELLAINNKHNNIVELLQPTKNIFIPIEENNTLEVEKCIKKRAYINAKNQHGKTPLHLVASFEQLNVLQLLLSSGAYVEVIDFNKNTPLHIAAEKDKIENIKLLLKYGAIYNTKNIRKKRPLDLAHGKSYDLLKQIDTLFEDIQSDNPQVNNNYLEMIHINHKIDISTIINTRDNQNNTLLHYAAKLGEFDCVKVLLENGAIFNAQNKLKRTPIDLTSDRGITTLLEAIKNMFEDVGNKRYQDVQNQGTDSIRMMINVRDKKGKGLLHYAAKFGNLNMVKFLVEKGADVNLIDIQGSGVSQDIIDYLKLDPENKPSGALSG